MPNQTQPQTKSFNFRIVQFFLNNTRITILALIVLIIAGIASTLLLKTTGFPSPEIGVVVVNTTYPGASSDTVLKDVTKPLEGVIKDVDGVDTYTSTTSNNSSVISITLKAGINSDVAQNKIDTTVKGVVLPSSVEQPKTIKPDIGGSDFTFAITGATNEQTYTTWEQIQTKIQGISATSTVKARTDLQKQITVEIDRDTLAKTGLQLNQIQTALGQLTESIPAVSGVSIDGKRESITTSVKIPQNLDDIKNISFTVASKNPNAQPSKVVLSDVAQVRFDYTLVNPERNTQQFISYKKDGNIVTQPALIFDIKTVSNTNLTQYIKDVEDKVKTVSNTNFITNPSSSDLNGNQVNVLETYSASKENDRQVNEVISGLVGGKLSIKNQVLANLGWILGGIQLVFLVMVAFVSWRAALVAAGAIPLSLIFSNIYLYFTGQSLNTLVLFSLVLVIGLVVDPALVILESIQRKIDTGLTGKEATLAAVQDVGAGLFMASLTNIIVFLPFGLISGVLGQIFSYIPLTIIPATIGSYVVPLVFLSWIGGLFLRPSSLSKHANTNESIISQEVKNLWGAAKWLINLNKNILHGSRWARVVIVVLALIIPFAVAGFYFSTGKIKSVQFSSGQNPDYLILSAASSSSNTQETTDAHVQELLAFVAKQPGVIGVYPFQQGTYRVDLAPAIDRDGMSKDLAADINKDLQTTFADTFLDVNVDIGGTGPPSSDYQVQLAVKTNDLAIMKSASFDIAATLNKVCISNNTASIDDDCSGDRAVEKVDDGYTGKENKVLDAVFDKDKISSLGLILPTAGTPQTALVNQTITNLYGINGNRQVGKVVFDGNEIPLYLTNNKQGPNTLEDVKNIQIQSLSGQSYRLTDVATIVEKTPSASIKSVKGDTLGVVQARLKQQYSDQQTSAKITQAVLDYYHNDDSKKTTELSLAKDSIEQYSEGGAAGFLKSFSELLLTLVMAIVATYFVLAIFFKSLLQPVGILLTIPLTFVGIFPALSSIGTGEFGFLEIIGLIILIGIVENVAIFLIDAANQIMKTEGMNEKDAIATASGLRLRSVLLTKFTAIASLAPLAWLSETYRPISLVIIFGLLTSGFASLVTTPILFIFFRWLSVQFRSLRWYHRIFFFPFFPIYIIVLAIRNKQVM